MKTYNGVAAFEDALREGELTLEMALGWAPDGAYYFLGSAEGGDDRIVRVVP